MPEMRRTSVPTYTDSCLDLRNCMDIYAEYPLLITNPVRFTCTLHYAPKKKDINKTTKIDREGK